VTIESLSAAGLHSHCCYFAPVSAGSQFLWLLFALNYVDSEHAGSRSALTIRNLDPQLKSRIQILSKINGRTMAGEIRALLTLAVGLGLSEVEAKERQALFQRVQKSNTDSLLTGLTRNAKGDS
jgi:plasmid stability protein